MKHNPLNLRLLGLSLCYTLIAVLSRPLFSLLEIDNTFLYIVAGLAVPPMIFYFSVTFGIFKHQYREILYLTLGFILYLLLTYNPNDHLFIIKIIALIMGGALCCITFIDRVNQWFMRNNRNYDTPQK